MPENVTVERQDARSKLIDLVPIGDVDFPSMTLGDFLQWTEEDERECLCTLAFYHRVLPGDGGDPLAELQERRGELMDALAVLVKERGEDEPLRNLYPQS